jgi:hypothetical protein
MLITVNELQLFIHSFNICLEITAFFVLTFRVFQRTIAKRYLDENHTDTELSSIQDSRLTPLFQHSFLLSSFFPFCLMKQSHAY